MPKKATRRKIKEAAVLYSAAPVPFRESFEASITAKGQIVIPASMRRKYGITPQTRIVIYEEGQQIVLKPITAEAIRLMHGSLKGSGMVKALLEERAKDREREDAKFNRSRSASRPALESCARWPNTSPPAERASCPTGSSRAASG